MNGEYINAGALWVLAHPSRAAYALIDLEVMQDTLEQKLAATEALLQSERSRADRAEAAHRKARAEADRAEAEAKRLRAELDGHLDFETQLREFEAKLDGVEEMKRRYEERIALLQNKLKEKESQPVWRPRVITTQPGVPQLPYETDVHGNARTAGDPGELMDETDFDVPEENPEGGDATDDDWLEPLPDF